MTEKAQSLAGNLASITYLATNGGDAILVQAPNPEIAKYWLAHEHGKGPYRIQICPQERLMQSASAGIRPARAKLTAQVRAVIEERRHRLTMEAWA